MNAARQAMENARRILIVSHLNPDGDAVGSTVALAHIALRLGKEARLYLASGIPSFLRWLEPPVPLDTSLDTLADWRPDLILLADCGDAARAGQEVLDGVEGRYPGLTKDAFVTLNVDHHVSNPGFADVNWVDPSSAATGELVGMLAEHMDIPLVGDLGMALYLALVSDTGNFTFSNTSASCLDMASRIVAQGLDVSRFTGLYENNWSLARMHLWGRLLQEIRLCLDGKVACSIVPRGYLEQSGLGKDALDGYASWLRKLRGVKVGLFVREDAPGSSKISLRATSGLDMSVVAGRFGGGGHAAAAGAELPLPPQEAAEAVLEELAARI